MKIVAFDLETTDLKALMGRILCASFYPITGFDAEPYTLRADAKPYANHDVTNDRKLAEAIRDELQRYHMIVGWNSKMFDLPLLNARLVHGHLAPCRPQFHLDLMWYAGGSSMRIGSKKLVNVQRFLKLSESKTEIDWEQWQRAAALDKAAMDEVVEHCEKDVEVLAEAYWRLLPMVANIHR